MSPLQQPHALCTGSSQAQERASLLSSVPACCNPWQHKKGPQRGVEVDATCCWLFSTSHPAQDAAQRQCSSKRQQRQELKQGVRLAKPDYERGADNRTRLIYVLRHRVAK